MTAVPDPVTCWHCPAVLHRVAIPELDEWGWADESGQRFGDDPDVARLKPNPYAYLADLGDRALAMMKATPRSKPHPPECARLMAAYSALKVRLDFGGTFHEHYPREWPPGTARPPRSTAGGPAGCARPAGSAASAARPWPWSVQHDGIGEQGR